MGKKSSTSKSSSTTENNPWAPAQDQLKDILNEAQSAYEKNGSLDGNWIDKNYPDLTEDMKTALLNMSQSGSLKNVADQINTITQGAAGNVNDASNQLNALSQGGITGQSINDLAGQLYDNETVKSQTAQLGKDINQAYEGQVNQLNQQAGATGNMGSSRAGVAQGVMSGKANEALAKGSADIANNARTASYNQALGTLQGNQATNLSAAGALGSLGMNQGQLQAGNASLQQQILNNQTNSAAVTQDWLSGQANTDWMNATGNANSGWENLAKYLQTVGSIGSMGGTSQTNSTSTTPSSGGGFGGIAGGILSGAGAGGQIGRGNPWAALGGGVLGGLGGAFSDASMKKKVKRKGKTKSGVSTYEWEWNDSAKKQGMKGKGEGVLAQEVAKKKPDSVKKEPVSGKLMVDYDSVGVKSKNSKPKKK